jgi:hypothetical protein
MLTVRPSGCAAGRWPRFSSSLMSAGTVTSFKVRLLRKARRSVSQANDRSRPTAEQSNPAKPPLSAAFASTDTLGPLKDEYCPRPYE